MCNLHVHLVITCIVYTVYTFTSYTQISLLAIMCWQTNIPKVNSTCTLALTLYGVLIWSVSLLSGWSSLHSHTQTASFLHSLWLHIHMTCMCTVYIFFFSLTSSRPIMEALLRAPCSLLASILSNSFGWSSPVTLPSEELMENENITVVWSFDSTGHEYNCSYWVDSLQVIWSYIGPFSE